MAFTTMGEIRDIALTKAGEVASTQSKYYAKMLEYVSISYMDILSASNKFEMDFDRPWTWARETVPIQVNLKAPYTSGTISFTTDSANASFSIAPAVSLAGWYIYADGLYEVYRIATHTAGQTAFTIVGTFVGASASFGHKTVKLSYDLGANILRLADPAVGYRLPAYGNGEYQLYSISPQQLATDYPIRSMVVGMPLYFAETNVKDSIYEITFSGYVDTDTKVEFYYIAKPGAITANTVPLIPLKDREVLAFCAASMLQFAEKSNPAAGSIMLNLAKAKLKSMSDEETNNLRNSGRWNGRIIARPGQIGYPFRYNFRGF